MEMPSSLENKLNKAFSFIEGFTNLERTPVLHTQEYKLGRMRVMLEYFHNPQDSFRTIHVAGSKGKGSTSTITSVMLEKHGFKTGLFTSPHLISYTERITLAGKPFNYQVYIDEIEKIKEALKDKNFTGEWGSPTTFELLTLLAFIMFRDEKCQWAVIETGMGGRLDSTNLIIPEISIITPIELEHCDILGDTIEKIAFEKAGIIKTGVPVVVQHQHKAALEVLRKKAVETGSNFIYQEESASITGTELTPYGTSFTAEFTELGIKKIRTNLTGSFQIDNIISGIIALITVLPDFQIEKCVQALKSVPLEGRMEVLKTKPEIIIDGSHTENSVQKLSASLNAMYRKKGILIFGSVAGKNYKAMMNILVPNFTAVIVSRPEGFKECHPEEQYEYGMKNFPEVKFYLENEKIKALKLASELASKNNAHIVATGSFYLAGKIKELIIKGETDEIHFSE